MLRFTARNYARIAAAALTRRVPVYAHFGITHRCNLTCKMCGIWRYGNEKEELSADQLKLMAGRMARLGVVQLSIGGGEPFASARLEDACSAFLAEGLNLRVLTNGIGEGNGRNVVRSSAYLDRVDRVIDLGVKSFSVSLDSLYPKRFDYICEIDGAWDEAVRTMTHMAGRLAGRPGALPTINCVVSNLNLEELPDMVRFAEQIGFAVSFLPIELLPDPKAGQRNWEARFIRYRPELGLNIEDAADAVHRRVDAAYDALIEMKAAGKPILNSTPYLEASRRYLKTGQFPAEGCDAGRLYFSVAPNGQFTICHRTEQQHLDFLDPNFEAYFHSAEYEQARLIEAGGCEGCMRACWIDTSSMFRTIEGFFETAKLTLRPPRTGHPATFAEASQLARRDEVELPAELIEAAAGGGPGSGGGGGLPPPATPPARARRRAPPRLRYAPAPPAPEAPWTRPCPPAPSIWPPPARAPAPAVRPGAAPCCRCTASPSTGGATSTMPATCSISRASSWR